MPNGGDQSPEALLAQSVANNERLRSRNWQIRFRLVWGGVLAILVLFIIASLNVEFAFIERSTPFILAGIGLTILVSFLSISLATLLAALGALGRLSTNAMANAIASFYVSFFRGTPLILQLLFWYLALPQLGVVLDPVICAVGALGMNYGAYMTEIFRAGIQAVPVGQREAAVALGMSERTAFSRIVAPQAFRIVVPAIGNDFIAMLKDSALASTVSLQEILWRAQNVGRREFKTLQTFLIAAMVYWVLTIVFTAVQNRIESRLAAGDRNKVVKG
ncbi:MAG: amino acid ABC transporter permease [bacterium]|nr:amino acid ABC transporter permease [Candidatus Aquidulcis frankliniae]